MILYRMPGTIRQGENSRNAKLFRSRFVPHSRNRICAGQGVILARRICARSAFRLFTLPAFPGTGLEVTAGRLGIARGAALCLDSISIASLVARFGLALPVFTHCLTFPNGARG